MKRTLNIFFICIILVVIYSCDAPKLNPLDPENPDYKLVALEGYVRSSSSSQTPISGVKVYWKEQKILTLTNETGYFKIEDLPKNNGILIFEKDGFSPDSTQVVWGSEKRKRVDISMNALPVMNKYSLYTTVENNYPDVQTFKLTAQVSVSDVDNRIDSVIIKCSAINFTKRLNFNAALDMFERTFTLGDMGISSMDEVIGKTFDFESVDNNKRAFKIGVGYLTRIIKQEITIDSPSNRAVVGASPKLKWFRFNPGFIFEYTVQIFAAQIIPVLVWEKAKISSDEIELTANANLPVGEYFWVIWCTDIYQNKCRSKPASFVVQ